LCSTIAFFEDAFSEFERARKTGDNHVNGQSMALTGVQGTGKSILGPIIALVMAKAFGWCVFYSWDGETISIGGDANSNKRIAVQNLSRRNTKTSFERFTLLVTSANNERWHDTAQQESWSAVYGNFMFIDCVPQAEILDMASTIVPTTGLTVDQVQENYNLAGGVARLCLQRPDVTSQLLEGAFQSLELRQCWRSLERLSDKDTVNSTTSNALLVELLSVLATAQPSAAGTATADDDPEGQCVAELRHQLLKRGLDVDGSRETLVKRLKAE
jgi:hypothetical protein